MKNNKDDEFKNYRIEQLEYESRELIEYNGSLGEYAVWLLVRETLDLTLKTIDILEKMIEENMIAMCPCNSLKS